MKFDFCIGNPPYQQSREKTKDMPVYNNFMDAAYNIANKVELITPARFLFNAGATPKKWNKERMNDIHFKVLRYEKNSTSIFTNTDIKGGIAITYRDEEKDFGKIGVFTIYPELNTITNKVLNHNRFDSLMSIMYSPANCKFTDFFITLKKEEVSKLSEGNEKMLATNVFESLNETTFFSNKPKDENSYIKVIGRYKNERVLRWVDSRYVEGGNILTWKVCLPKTSGIGRFGEQLSMPVVLENNVAHTQSFFSVGNCTKEEAFNILKYIKSKFARALLGVLKVTQDCPPAKWKYVPLQDFSNNSDIDWSKSIPEIDQQLYLKYGLSEEEINFIETNVKEMN